MMASKAMDAMAAIGTSKRVVQHDHSGGAWLRAVRAMRRFRFARGLFALLRSISILQLPAIAQESNYVRVRIDIPQEPALEQESFEAPMTIISGLPDGTPTDLSVEVCFEGAIRCLVPFGTPWNCPL